MIPSCCRICHHWPSAVLCGDCLSRFAPTTHRCTRCALPLPSFPGNAPDICGHCLLHPGPLSHCLAAVDYGYPWDRLITRLKFHEDTALAAQFAPLLHRLPHAQQLLQSCDALIPMPLSAQRLRERGFNQAGLLARSLFPGKIRHDILLRVLHTRAQSECTLAERMNNVRHAFAVQPGQQSQAQDRHFVLVDDVMTTGASLTHAAQVLLQAGARQVSAIVLARTPSQSESH